MNKQVKIIGLVIGILIILAQCGLNSYFLLTYCAQNKIIKDLREEIESKDSLIKSLNDSILKYNVKSTCAIEGEMCGGFAGILCCEGLTCWMESEENYPDQSGICIKE